jgi:hypothetical protein
LSIGHVHGKRVLIKYALGIVVRQPHFARYARPNRRPRVPTRQQADQARQDFAILLDELDFLKMQLSRLPTRKWLSRMALIGFGSVWALLAVLLLMLAR